MRWCVKLNSETETELKIGYSYSEDLCDGIISYNKSDELFTIEKYSSTADEYESKRTFQFLYSLINNERLTTKKYRICTG